jgi:predicted small secreted protein
LDHVSWKKFLLGLGIGFAGALILKSNMPRQPVSPEKALRIVKNEMKKHGPIDGSWIHMIPEPYQKNQVTYQVYKGGISRTVNGKLEQFEFLVDADTGVILELC